MGWVGVSVNVTSSYISSTCFTTVLVVKVASWNWELLIAIWDVPTTSPSPVPSKPLYSASPSAENTVSENGFSVTLSFNLFTLPNWLLAVFKRTSINFLINNPFSSSVFCLMVDFRYSLFY